jgi:hypothetical protein
MNSASEALDRWMMANGFDAQARAGAVASFQSTGPPAFRAVPWEQFELELIEQYGPTLRAKSTPCAFSVGRCACLTCTIWTFG